MNEKKLTELRAMHTALQYEQMIPSLGPMLDALDALLKVRQAAKRWTKASAGRDSVDAEAGLVDILRETSEFDGDPMNPSGGHQ